MYNQFLTKTITIIALMPLLYIVHYFFGPPVIIPWNKEWYDAEYVVFHESDCLEKYVVFRPPDNLMDLKNLVETYDKEHPNATGTGKHERVFLRASSIAFLWWGNRPKWILFEGPHEQAVARIWWKDGDERKNYMVQNGTNQLHDKRMTFYKDGRTEIFEDGSDYNTQFMFMYSIGKWY